jgi:RES domain-containing protein
VIQGALLDSALKTVRSRPHRDIFYRATPLIYAHDPLGKNRKITRQHFNIHAGARALYFSHEQATCLSEVQATGLPALAVAIIPVEVQLNACIDLRDPATLVNLQLTQVELAFNFRSLPVGSPPTDMQVLGEHAAASGCVDGLLFESLALAGQTNLVVFEANLAGLNSKLTVNDPISKLFDQLP